MLADPQKSTCMNNDRSMTVGFTNEPVGEALSKEGRVLGSRGALSRSISTARLSVRQHTESIEFHSQLRRRLW